VLRKTTLRIGIPLKNHPEYLSSPNVNDSIPSPNLGFSSDKSSISGNIKF